MTQDFNSVTRYCHIKTGNFYIAMNQVVTDCTNSRAGTPVVIYMGEHSGEIYVREADEFNEKFKPVTE